MLAVAKTTMPESRTPDPKNTSRYLNNSTNAMTPARTPKINKSSNLMNQDGNIRYSGMSPKFVTPSKRLEDELMKEKVMANIERSAVGLKAYNTDKIGLEVSLSAKEEQLDNITTTTPGRQDKTLSLLHDHIKDMTSIMRRLSRDMERCEAAVASNTVAIATIATRISCIESNSIINTDLDNRINRCDVGIKEIVREVRECSQAIIKTRQTTDNQLTTQVKNNETVERRFVDLERAMRCIDTEQNHQIASLKDQTKELGSVSLSLERGVSKDMSQLKAVCLNRVQLLVSETEARYNSQIEIRDLRIEEINDSLKRAIAQINGDIDKIKKEQTEASKTHSRLRGECMSGFKTLQDSVDTMHSILDSKIRLIEEDLRSEIKKSYQTVVVT